MAMPRAQLEGKIFGRLTVIAHVRTQKNGSVWGSQCSCGNYTEVITSGLNSGGTQSCGCWTQTL